MKTFFVLVLSCLMLLLFIAGCGQKEGSQGQGAGEAEKTMEAAPMEDTTMTGDSTMMMEDSTAVMEEGEAQGEGH